MNNDTSKDLQDVPMEQPKDYLSLDNHHIFDAIGAQPDQLLANYGDEMQFDLTETQGRGITSIVVAGMGGSALAANVLRNWLYDRIKVPFEIVRGSSVPGYVDNHTLVIASSYSGNTEETLAALDDAEKRNAAIIILTNGGKLADIARSKNYNILNLPESSQPRFAVFAGLKALTCTLADLKLAEGVDLRRELIDAAGVLNEVKFGMCPDNEDNNEARKIARDLREKPVIIYGTPGSGTAAYKWKINLNENSKQLAWYNVYSELDHNEFQGWLFPKEKSVAAIQLTTDFDSAQISKRVEVTTRILNEYGFNPIAVHAKGATPLQQLLYLILMGDYVSAYLGLMNGVDPMPVELVEKLKKELS